MSVLLEVQVRHRIVLRSGSGGSPTTAKSRPF